MRWMRNLIYTVALVTSLPWLLYRALWLGKNRYGWWTRLTGRVAPRQSNRPCLLCHAVSVGEVNLLVPLIAEVLRRNPETEVIVSATTASGFEMALRRFPDLRVVRMPWDFSWAVDTWLGRLRPNRLWLAELEIWPNLIDGCFRRQIPVSVVNGRLGEKSFRGYRKARWWMGQSFPRLHSIAAQTGEIGERFQQLGCPRVEVTGNLKFDGVVGDRANPEVAKLAAAAGWEGDFGPVWVAGSTQPEEDQMVLDVFRQLRADWPRLKLVFVPRHPQNVPALVRQLELSGFSWQRRSKPFTGRGTVPIMVVDVIGELAHWWGLADIGYVGGSMGNREGQNMIEPAAYGVAISFGPRTKNFREVVRQLLAERAAVVVRDGNDLRHFVEGCLNDPAAARARGQRARRLVTRHQGSAARTVDFLWPETQCDAAARVA